MAGYIFSLDSVESLQNYASSGVYATKLNPPQGGLWKGYHEGTFADYATMQAGDNIYFFIKRKIYGIGTLINIAKGDCKFSNYPGACEPLAYPHSDEKSLLWNEGTYSVDQRWICTFIPAPYFFSHGIDMDDVLASEPDAFRMLRAFWKVSFIKFDDEENQAFKNILLRSNEIALQCPQPNTNVFPSQYLAIHKGIAAKVDKGNYGLDIRPFLKSCHEKECIRHEMAIEAGLLYQLANQHKAVTDIFGTWDYLSHQVIASPFKPIDYIDKMDVFGYSFINGHKPTRSKYLLAELKRDAALVEDVEQTMKYVDWVKDEYCHSNYSMISAFLVASDFSDEVIKTKQRSAKRQYVIGRRPAQSFKWSDLKLVKYRYNKSTSMLDFEIVD